MGANVGAGQKLGQFVGGNIQKQAGSFGQQVGQQYGQFVNEAEKNRKQYDTSTQFAQNTIQDAGKNLYGNTWQQAGQTQNQQAPTAPQIGTGQGFADLSKEQQTALTGSQANQELIKRFADLRSGKYAGPTNLMNAQGEDITGQVMNKAQQIGQLGQQTRSNEGRASLLQQNIVNPGYTQDKQALDRYLLGANRAALNPARQQAFAAQRTGTGAATSSQQLGKFFGQEAKAVGEKTGELLSTEEAAQQKALEAKATSAQEARQKRFEELQKQITSGSGDLELTKKEAADLGLKGGEELYSGYGQALTLDPTQAAAQNVADINQFQNIRALRELAAKDTGVYGDVKQAGKFYENQYDLNQDMAKQIRENAITDALNAAGGNIATMASALRAAQDPFNRSTHYKTGTGILAQMGLDQEMKQQAADEERRIANEQKNAAMTELARRGFTTTGDLASAFGDVNNRDNWYKYTYGDKGDFGSGVASNQGIRNILKSARSFKIKDDSNA
jgi:hypothetical protein